MRDWTERLHREQLTFQQIRETTRQVIAIMWNMAGDTERAMRVGSGLGNLDEEWDAAVQALTEDQIRGLCAICDAACPPPCLALRCTSVQPRNIRQHFAAIPATRVAAA